MAEKLEEALERTSRTPASLETHDYTSIRLQLIQNSHRELSKLPEHTCLKVNRGLSLLGPDGEGERGQEAGDEGPLVGLSHMAVS